MTGAVVAMCLIGLALILISFFISDSSVEQSESFDLDLLTVNEDYEFSDREQSIIRRKIEDVISKQAKEILLETGDSLANMANEKMLALGDYAVAVCDEIEKNHKEVMFLYSMLDDKQKEIMRTVKQVDETVRMADRFIDRMEEQLSEEASRSGSRMGFEDRYAGKTESLEASHRAEELQRIEDSHKMVDPHRIEDSQGAEELRPASNRKSKASGGSRKNRKSGSGSGKKRGTASTVDPYTDAWDSSAELERTQAMRMEELSMEEEIRRNRRQAAENPVPGWSDEGETDPVNANEEILALYQAGESVIDIAKQLGLGVGEVKLVIDLYQGE